MLENSEIDIEINKKNMFKSKVEGSPTTTAFRDFSDKAQQYKMDLQSISTLLDNAKFIKDSVNIEKYSAELEKLKEELYEFPYTFISENNESFVTLQVIENQLRTTQLDFDKLKMAFEDLSDNVKTSEPALRLKGKMDLIENQVKRAEAVQIGKVAPSFSAPDPEGNMVSLEDVKGKVTIIDFWAAWCGPCRRENPNVVRVYNKYHDKGLEIIGVSLDGTRSQQDPKASWLAAIEADKLTWHHVSNLKHFAEPVAQLYNINSIPATFILDENGTIVAKNLRGMALELKIAELLGE
ncbi:MAG: TlpA family protein disulfide reductase [Winogradskyella sp.]|nr:TlpA family protein disulfide reductase [Winogradskyella sp.]MBT8375668.1 TlpA family protein disulfide reductase [Bacteroidia bacterium]NNC45859.1 TlpA family protein disulfide reductase [Winogradskyella sp.]NNF86746.1 TlpA family protein disulfide reductase [Winogradskyella sp.]NNK40668.1 TlpA family protein disulfide reductase [Winogradskyella sp.]